MALFDASAFFDLSDLGQELDRLIFSHTSIMNKCVTGDGLNMDALVELWQASAKSRHRTAVERKCITLVALMFKEVVAVDSLAQLPFQLVQQALQHELLSIGLAGDEQCKVDLPISWCCLLATRAATPSGQRARSRSQRRAERAGA